MKKNSVFLLLGLFISSTTISCIYNPNVIPRMNPDILYTILAENAIPNLRCQLNTEQLIHEGFTLKGTTKISYGPNIGTTIDVWGIGKDATVEYQNLPLKRGYDVNEYYYDGNLAEIPDGGYRIWKVEGSSAIQGFTDSVKSSISQIKITSPLNTTDVSKSTPLIISWSQSKDTDDVISLLIYNIHEGTSIKILRVKDTGSLTIPLSTLSQLSEGETVVDVYRGHYKKGIVANGDVYIMTYITEHNLEINLIK